MSNYPKKIIVNMTPLTQDEPLTTDPVLAESLKRTAEYMAEGGDVNPDYKATKERISDIVSMIHTPEDIAMLEEDEDQESDNIF